MRQIFIIFAIMCSLQTLQSQSFGVGFAVGGCQYKGDLAEDNEGLYENLRPMKGITAYYNFSSKISVTGSFISTYLMAYDKDAHTAGRQLRNLHFKSNLQELSFCTEVYPVAFFTKKSTWIKPFLKGGFAFFHFNPQASLNGVWHDLQPLRTEGQGLPLSNNNPYSLFEIAHPFGIGFKIDIKKFSIKYEISPRNTDTDYLDDVSGNYYNLDELRKYSSDIAAKLAYRTVDWPLENTAPIVDNMQRGNAKNDDWYVIHQVSILYTISTKTKATTTITEPIETLPVIK